MYQKRPAWILTGVAPNKGAATRLSDITLAVQTEIPLVKQHLCDQLWTVRNHQVHTERVNRLDHTRRSLTLRPSTEPTIAHGFASLSRFFPGARDVLAAIDDEIALGMPGQPTDRKAVTFEDQYISTGGQLYELMAGHDRFLADVRPLLAGILEQRGLPHALCCHPYDMCTMLIAEQLGVILTDGAGYQLDAPMTLDADVAWAGYANTRLHASIEPLLLAALRRHGLANRTSAELRNRTTA